MGWISGKGAKSRPPGCRLNPPTPSNAGSGRAELARSLQSRRGEGGGASRVGAGLAVGGWGGDEKCHIDNFRQPGWAIG